MIANSLLSIVIPTFNRADLLDYCLGFNIPLARVKGVEIFIFDNASSDDTENVVKRWMGEYCFVRYIRNDVTVGPDENFEKALKHPGTEYVWLLGDSYILPIDGINYVLEMASRKCEMLLFNIDNEVVDVVSSNYTDQNLLLLDLFWLMTCMSCLVYRRDLILAANFQRYRGTNFIQTGVVFEYISGREFVVNWQQSISVKRWGNCIGLKKESWHSNVFEIWFKNRANFIFSLPASYDIWIKLRLAKEVHLRDKVSLRGLLGYRFCGVLDYKSYKMYKDIFEVTLIYPSFVVLFFSLIPRGFISKIRLVKRLFSR